MKSPQLHIAYDKSSIISYDVTVVQQGLELILILCVVARLIFAQYSFERMTYLILWGLQPRIHVKLYMHIQPLPNSD